MEAPPTPPAATPDDPRRGRLSAAWILLAVAALMHAASVGVIFGLECRADLAFIAYATGAALSLLVFPMTLIQQVRAPSGNKRWGQALGLYVGAGVLVLWAVIALLPFAMSMDSC